MTSQQYACWLDKQQQRELKKLAKTMPKPEPRLDHPMDGFMPVINGKREKDLHNAVLAHCKAQGWFVVHSRTDKRTTNQLGTPDCLIFADKGRFWAIELKKPGAKLRPDQLVVRAVLKRLGHDYRVCASFAEVLTVFGP